MYRSSPFRSTLNRGYIACLGMWKVCTEAVHSVALCPAKKAQTPKHGPGKKDRNRARGVFQGRRTSRSAGIYIYMGVSKNSGFYPQIIHGLIGFSIINHPFWGVFPLFLETPICVKSTWNPKQPFSYWIFGDTTIFYVKIWNHPNETTIKKWLFRVPGNDQNPWYQRMVYS